MSEPAASHPDEAGERAIAVLALAVAHDLNNAMGVIMGRAQLLLMDLPADSSLREDLEEIALSARASAEFTTRLLAYVRKQVHASSPAEVDAVVASVRSILHETLHAARRR